MKVIGTTEKGCIVEMADLEMARVCGFEHTEPFEAFLLSNRWNGPTEFLSRRSTPAAGVEIPVGEWYHQLVLMRSLLPMLKHMARTLHRDADSVDKAVALLSPLQGDEKKSS